MVNDNDYVAIFHSIHRVLRAEEVLKAAGVEFLLIPVPRQLTADCGLALRVAPARCAELLSVLAAADLAPAELFQRRSEAFVGCDPPSPTAPAGETA